MSVVKLLQMFQPLNVGVPCSDDLCEDLQITACNLDGKNSSQ
jgi:hypothetical protein